MDPLVCLCLYTPLGPSYLVFMGFHISWDCVRGLVITQKNSKASVANIIIVAKKLLKYYVVVLSCDLIAITKDIK